jgi:uncharacterized protein YprB with RNaseH-like and TPR domain
MSLRDRLDRLTGDAKPARPEDDKQKKISELRARIEQILERRPTAADGSDKSDAADKSERAEPVYTPLGVESVAKGDEVATPYGKVFVATDEFDAGLFWGRRRLREMQELDMAAAARLADDPRLAGLAPADALFLDTETTGLAGGTGTLAFLIGVGWFAGDRFVTRLIFARDFTEEAAALSVLRTLAVDRKFLVSFNGKTFDMALLAARFVLNRQPDPLGGLPHLDLLHPSRRLLGHRLDNSRLVTIEEAVLGRRRVGDVPGSEIPQRYFDYLRSRDARLIADILDHNRQDIVSLGVLAVHLAELLTRGVATPDAEPSDVVAAARLHVLRGDPAAAEKMLRDLLAARVAETVGEGGRELSLLHKRAGRWDDAVALWRAQLAADPFDLFAVEEMAKWLEHRRKEWGEAMRLVAGVLDAPVFADEAAREAFRYRLARLQRKAKGLREEAADGD